MRVFFESSAFAKLFVAENGTQKVADFYLNATSKALSALAWLEVRSAIARRERMGDLSHEDAAVAVGMLQAEVSNFETIAILPGVLIRAESLLVNRQLRSLDAIQLATCLAWQMTGSAITFLCADKHLRDAAVAEGLAVIDPGTLDR